MLLPCTAPHRSSLAGPSGPRTEARPYGLNSRSTRATKSGLRCATGKPLRSYSSGRGPTARSLAGLDSPSNSLRASRWSSLARGGWSAALTGHPPSECRRCGVTTPPTPVGGARLSQIPSPSAKVGRSLCVRFAPAATRGAGELSWDPKTSRKARQCRTSLGARMKTSQIMSGSCWLPDMNPTTLRPVASSTTRSKRSLMTSWKAILWRMTSSPRPPARSVCSTRVKPPRSSTHD